MVSNAVGLEAVIYRFSMRVIQDLMSLSFYPRMGPAVRSSKSVCALFNRNAYFENVLRSYCIVSEVEERPHLHRQASLQIGSLYQTCLSLSAVAFATLSPTGYSASDSDSLSVRLCIVRES